MLLESIEEPSDTRPDRGSEMDAVAALLDTLGIPRAMIAGLGLPKCTVAEALDLAETDASGYHHRMVPDAACAWRRMKDAAKREGVLLYVVSAFRTLEDQAAIIREKLARNLPLPTIFTLSAPPGYSEHHSGRAVDINTPGCPAREEPFEDTEAFRWLARHAGEFGFALSYPRNNLHGFIYEPWHWYYQTGAASEEQS